MLVAVENLICLIFLWFRPAHDVSTNQGAVGATKAHCNPAFADRLADAACLFHAATGKALN
jgi:hypothetical protein